jgi:hypothetical protein
VDVDLVDDGPVNVESVLQVAVRADDLVVGVALRVLEDVAPRHLRVLREHRLGQRRPSGRHLLRRVEHQSGLVSGSSSDEDLRALFAVSRQKEQAESRTKARLTSLARYLQPDCPDDSITVRTLPAEHRTNEVVDLPLEQLERDARPLTVDLLKMAEETHHLVDGGLVEPSTLDLGR